MAVNLYGYSRFTGDIDILLALDGENLKRVDELMKELGYVSRIPVDVKELGNRDKVKSFVEDKGMKAYTFLSNEKPQLDIDILVEESFDFDDFAKNKTVVEVWGLKLPVVSIDDLIGMKEGTDREKYALDVEALLKLKEL